MRIHGRVIRPSNLVERRLLLSLGHAWYRVPRDQNPHIVARKLRRLACMVPALLALPEATGPRRRAT